MNDLVNAERMAAQACKYSNNKNFDCLKLWADILFELKQFKKSLKIYELAQQIQPENDEIKENLKNIAQHTSAEIGINFISVMQYYTMNNKKLL